MSSENARVTELDDGLRVVTHHVPDVDTEIHISVMAGSRDEVDGNYPRGTQHMLEHGIACGSEKYPDPPRDYIEGGGVFAGIGGTFKPAARFDNMACDAKVPAQWTRYTLDVLGAMFSCPALLAQEVGHEKHIVQIERAANKLDVCSLENWQATYVGYDRHARLFPVAGSRTGIEAITPEILRDFHARHVRAGRTIIGVESALEHDEIVAYIRKSFSLPPGVRSLSETPVYSGGDARYPMLSEVEATRIAMAFKAPIQTDFRAVAACEVVVNLLAAANRKGKHSVFDAMRGRGVVYKNEVGSRRSLDAGLLTIAYVTFPEYVRDSLHTIQSVLSGLAEGVDDDSFDRVYDRERRLFQRLKESTILNAWRLAEDTLLHGQVLPAEYYSGLRLQVTKDEVREAVRQMLASPPTFLAVGDVDPRHLPGVDEVRDIFAPARAKMPVAAVKESALQAA